MILVTGASGRSGGAVTRAVAARGGRVRTFVRRPEAAEACRRNGAAEVAVGTLESDAEVRAAMAGIERVYHVAPPFSPAEEAYGRRLLAAAAAEGVRHFVFHSVYHAQCTAMVHHRLKLAVEVAVIESGLPYTVLQPAMYMQNIAVEWPEIVATGKYRRPYSPDVKMAVVDLEDVAAAAATVLAGDAFVGGSFELSSAPALSHAEMAEALSRELGRPVVAERRTFEDWAEKARARFGPEAIEIYGAMCRHYDAHGLPGGNDQVLRLILGRAPTGFPAFLARFAASRRATA
ncbi:MAG: NmrA family NAD(P)-binding protein [Dongiaceae bacterium]